MLHRYRTAFMQAEGAPTAGGAPATPAAPPAAAPNVPAAAAPPAAPAAELPADMKELVSNPEAFKARLAKEREQGTRALIKELGFEKIDDVKALLKQAKDDAEAKKTTEQKTQEKIAALEPAAKEAVTLKAAIAEYLQAEEKLIPEDKKGLLELAPPAEQPDARLKWISAAKAKGLFNTPAAPAAPAAPPLANTRAGGNPPPPAPANGQKHPRDMTDAEFKQYEAQWKANQGAQRG